jgi:hypothetical protein
MRHTIQKVTAIIIIHKESHKVSRRNLMRVVGIVIVIVKETEIAKRNKGEKCNINMRWLLRVVINQFIRRGRNVVMVIRRRTRKTML